MDNIGGSTPITVMTVHGTKTLYVKPKKRLKTDHSLEEKLIDKLELSNIFKKIKLT